MRFFATLALLGLACAYDRSGNETRFCTGDCQTPDTVSMMSVLGVMKKKQAERDECHKDGQCPWTGSSLLGSADAAAASCVNGSAAGYPCSGIDLQSFVDIQTLGGNLPSNDEGNDIWGWTDPDTQKEYAIVGLTDGTSFVDISNPTSPVVVAFMKTQTFNSIWRDIKVYQNHAFVVSEARNHGMQIFDLTRLRDIVPTSPAVQVQPDTRYTQFGSSHNMVINEATGFGYSVGTTTCSGGLHIMDLKNPKSPQFVSCYSSDGYTHDAECVVYNGIDHRFKGKEICFNYNEDTLTIVDVTDKDNMIMLSRTGYVGVRYSHQGWLTEDQQYLLLDDELDEIYRTGGNDGKTVTYIWDVSSLTNPINTGRYTASVFSIDHNLYIVGDRAYESNYESGLRILDVSQVDKVQLSEVAFFDVRPQGNTVEFWGAWSVYPWFKSGSVIVNSIERGLFVLKVTV